VICNNCNKSNSLQLVDKAKQLRRSSDPVIRETVYIDPNLTRAEAAAAYQVRVRRRTELQRRNKQPNDANVINADGSQPDLPPETDGKSDSHRPLNPMANMFNPAPASKNEPGE
jgi:hypothetical protein